MISLDESLAEASSTEPVAVPEQELVPTSELISDDQSNAEGLEQANEPVDSSVQEGRS